MTIRMKDTELWNEEWFQDLSMNYKFFWFYVNETCNHAGIWRTNWKTVTHVTGIVGPLDPTPYGPRVKVLASDKWYLTNFICEQQRIPNIDKLNPHNKCHTSIIKILYEEKIINDLSPLLAPIEGLARGHSNGNSNGKNTTYTYNKDKYNYNVSNTNKIKADNVDYIVPPLPEAIHIDYTTPEQRYILTGEVEDFKKIGFKVEKIKGIYLHRGVPEFLVDELLGKKF